LRRLHRWLLRGAGDDEEREDQREERHYVVLVWCSIGDLEQWEEERVEE
jgi:hypothetical protein